MTEGWDLHSSFWKEKRRKQEEINFFPQINLHAFNISFSSRQAMSGICQQSSSEQNAAMIKNKEGWRGILVH